MITIGIAEDHHLVRQGVVALLKMEADFRVVGEAENGFDALRLVASKHPDILLLDLSIPGVHGLEVTRQICTGHGKTNGALKGMTNGARNEIGNGSTRAGHGTNNFSAIGATRVIILSMHKDEAFVIEALRNGAFGYVLKDSSASDLLEAVRKVKMGRKYLSPSLADFAVTTLAHKALEPSSDGYDQLSSRERLILQMAAEGQNTHEIAERLFISPRTAETHRANFMRKLRLHSQTDLVRFAIRRNLMSA